MAQELKSKIVIIGAGPSGCTCAYYLQDKFDVTIIDKKEPLLTLLPTGGTRCNLAHAEYDYRELAKNYPRGEKFLYSIFSRFGTYDTLEFFKQIGVETYLQDDNRFFPVSNSSKDVREKFLKALKNVKFIKEEALRINKNGNRYKVVTNMASYDADYVVISIGGHSSFELIKLLGHNIVPLKPSLTGLQTKEDFSSLAGVSVNDILFTHKGLSGPKIYKISSLYARKEFPYKLSFCILEISNLQELLNSNPHKSVKNLLGEFIPKSLSEYILKNLQIDIDAKCHTIDGATRDKIINKLNNFQVTVTKPFADGEVVMSGGVDLKEVNSKTLESKINKNIYFCGEVLDIDGFCGGFNLQNCWSDGFVVADSILHA